LSLADAHRWNIRYADEKHFWRKIPPKQLLLDYEYLLPSSGRVLDAAAGVGAPGKFLANKGFTVFSFDISIEGLKMAQEEYRASGAKFLGAVVDLSTIQFSERFFDVIINFCFLDRATFTKYRRALKPGGLIFFETFIRGHEDLKYSHHCLEPGELEAEFKDYEILHSKQTYWKNTKRRSRRKVAQLIARKR
jgi:SAM-dependent methyltransferase